MTELGSTTVFRQLIFQEVFFGILSIIFLALAASRGFFRLDSPQKFFVVSFKKLFLAFFLYLCTTLVLSYPISIIIGWMIPGHRTQATANVLYVGWVNILLQGTALSAILGATIYFFPGLLRSIFLLSHKETPSWGKSIAMGFIGCFVALPLVHLISNSFDVVMYWFYHVQSLPDQQAVQYLKMAMQSPFSFFLAFISISILAPLLEELLFRGFLQNWLKAYLSRGNAIGLTSLVFACFHYSSYQGLANFSVISSLFVLAIFLGFIYERQQNLISSIVLHATFNSISVLSIFLFKEI